MNRRLLALGAILVLVSGCTAAAGGPGASSSGPGPVTLTDALGRQVSFASPPARIAIAGKAAFLVSDAVFMFPEASSRVVALPKATQGKVDFVSVLDTAYAQKTILDGNAGPEAVAAVHPDAVITKSSSASTLGQPLEAMGIKVVYVDFETPDQYTRDLGTLGALFGDPARATALTEYFSRQVSRVQTAVASASARPKVLLLSYSSKNGTTAFQVPPASFIQTTEVELAGGEPVWEQAHVGSGWTTMMLEQIAAWNPDQVYVVAYFDRASDVVASILADARWQTMAAVKSHAVMAFPGDFTSWDEPDPRWALGLVWLAVHVHPELAASFPLDREIRDFYTQAYGLGAASFDSIVKPHLPALP